MAIDFPQSPATGDQFTAGATTYEYDGEKWISTGTSPNTRISRGANTLEINSGNDLVWTGDNFGIGIANPSVPLHISGTNGILIDDSTNQKRAEFRSKNDVVEINAYDTANANAAVPIVFKQYTSERLRITDTNTQFTGRIFINGTEGGFDYNNVANTLEFLTTDGSTHSELNANAYVPAGTKNLGANAARWDNVYCNDVNLGADQEYAKNEYRGSVPVTNANTDSFAFRLRGSNLGSGGRLYMSGTSGNVVVNVVADIMVSHSGHIAVQSMSNGYTQGRIRIVSDSNENADVFIGRSNGFATGTTNLGWRFIPFGTSYIQTSAGNYSSTTHTHATTANSYRISATSGGNVAASGSKTFSINHPLESLEDTTRLVHAAAEGPECNTIYRGKVDLVDGTSTVNIDTNSRMTEGTFEALNQNVQCFTTNETGWTAVKASVSGNLLTITAQDNTCTDTVSWMVVGERKDQDIINSDLTDSEGRLIPEITDEFDPSQYPEYVAPEEPAE